MSSVYRRKEKKVIMGVCGGLADVIGIDASLMRILWVLAALMTTIVPVAVAYFVLGIILPESGSGKESIGSKKAWTVSAAVVLICAGLLIVLNNIIDFPIRQYLLPATLIGGGVLLLVWAINRNGRK